MTEYLDGEDLDRRLGRVGRLGLPHVLDLVKQIASGLAAIHAKGFVHRDLKPANIFLLPMDSGADFVKLVDFGISKVRTSGCSDFKAKTAPRPRARMSLIGPVTSTPGAAGSRTRAPLDPAPGRRWTSARAA
jgi:serine/threonine protein kinase